jgi:thiol-disulfide isomerase/thioredoxin
VRGTAGIIALASAVLVGTLVVVFVQFQDGGGRRGVRVGGAAKAEASCTESAPRCLPKITMMDLAGREWRPEDLAGKVVVVNVWATWCKPCAEEIPDLRSLHRAYEKKGVVLLGLLNDNVADSTLDAFVDRAGIDYPVVRMDDELYAAFDEPDKLPTTFVYDKSGHLYFGDAGIMTEARLGAMLDKLLAD